MNPQEVELKQVVITKLTRRGTGTEEQPVRIVTEVWDAITGEKIAEYDPCAPKHKEIKLTDF